MHAIEQQIYASLAIPGLKAGHHTHATTPGMSASAAERHEQICNRWGEYEPGVEFTRALVHVPLWLDDDPPADPSHYATILVTYQGRDAGGRPGALLRHVVRVPAERYQGLDFHPFHLLRTGKLLETWTPDTPFPVLEPLSDPTRAEDLKAIFPERYGLLRALLGQLLTGGRMHLPSDQDSPAAEETLAQVLELVPVPLRRQLSVASYAQRNTKDFHVSVVRQEGLGFRASLAAVTLEDPADLPVPARRYLDQLFLALEAKDWTGALRLIHDTDIPCQTPVLSTATQTQAREVVEEEVDDGPKRDVPPEMPYRRREAPERKSRWPLFLGIGAGLAVILAVVLLAGRGGDDPGTVPTDFASFSGARGDDLGSLLAAYEQSGAGLITGGASDFDLEQSLHGAERHLDTQLERAWTGERARVERELRDAARGHGLSSPEVAAALRAAADRLQRDARRLAAFHATVGAGSAEPLRAGYDEEGRTLTLAPADQDPTAPGLTPIVGLASDLRSAATELSGFDTVGAGRDAAAWNSLATALEPLASRDSGASLLGSAAAAAAAMQDLVTAEEGLAAVASRLPYPVDTALDGAWGEPAARLLAATEGMDGVVLPPAMAHARTFHATWRNAIVPALGGDPASARQGLAAVAPLCPEGGGVCDEPAYAAHVGRWRIELWRKAGDPDGEAASLVTQHGDAVLPRGGVDQLKTVVPLLDAMQRTSLPAPPDAVARFQDQAKQVTDPVARAVVDGWMARNRRGSQGEQTRFRDLYARVQRQLDQLRRASATDAPARFAGLRDALVALRDVDLAQVDGPEVGALRELEQALAASADVRLDEVRIHLLRQADYSGTTRQVASLQLTVTRDGQKAPTLELGFPPMLWAPVVGFEALAQPVSGPIGLHPDDKLLIVARDQQTQSVWFHLRLAPPRRGHIVGTLAGEHRVRVDPAAAAAAHGSGSLPADGGTEEVAKVTFVLQDGWWSRYAAGLPSLP